MLAENFQELILRLTELQGIDFVYHNIQLFEWKT